MTGARRRWLGAGPILSCRVDGKHPPAAPPCLRPRTPAAVRVAVLSDTHGRAAAAAAALAVLNARDPDVFVHCGDVGDARLGHDGVLDELARAAAGRPVHLVAGNADRDPAALAAAAAARGLHFHEAPALLELAGVWVGLLHGHEPGGPARAAASGRFDVVSHGHTHRRRWAWLEGPAGGTGGRVRVLNPGAAWRADPRGVAVLELPGMTAELSDVPRGRDAA